MIMHTKYQCSIINTSEDMSQVKVFLTEEQKDGRTDRRRSFNVPRFRERRETKTWRSYHQDKNLDYMCMEALTLRT